MVQAAKQGLVTALIAGSFLGLGGFLFETVQAHAGTEDLKRVEEEAKGRDRDLAARLEDHLREAREEALRQARFRARVAEKLGLEPIDD